MLCLLDLPLSLTPANFLHRHRYRCSSFVQQESNDGVESVERPTLDMVVKQVPIEIMGHWCLGFKHLGTLILVRITVHITAS